MDSKAAPIIRIVRKKKGGGGHHGGAWKVAYADFVTALMAFFLVMWIVGLSASVKKAVAAYFRDPVGFMKATHGGKSPLSGGDEAETKNGKPAPIIPQDGGFNAIPMNSSQLEAVKKAISDQLMSSPELSRLQDSVMIHMTNEGLRIELIEKTSALFFNSGSAQLKPLTVHLLAVIAHQIGKLKNPVIIEGHTDATPYNGANGYSNWELSADRANAARRTMETHGLRGGQVLAVRGYADRKLLDPKHPYSYVNRRVSILVAYTDKGE